MSTEGPVESRGPGRPLHDPEQPGVRARLVESAAELIAERGFAATSVRAIATHAGVTPAMIAYYFGDKEGLLEAILDSAFEHLLSGIRDLADADRADAEHFAARFVPLYMRTLASKPWIPHLIGREVLSADTKVRERFVDRFLSRAVTLVPALIEREIERGELRSDLDPQLTVLSMVGMSVFPFLAEPIVGPLLGYRIDPEFADRLADHTVRLFYEGAGAKEVEG